MFEVTNNAYEAAQKVVRLVQPYAKAAVAVAGVIAVVGNAVVDGTVTRDEAEAIVVSVAVAAGVYRVRNAQRKA